MRTSTPFGKFTTTRQVASVLSGLGKELGADTTLLLVYDADRIFGSLCLIVQAGTVKPLIMPDDERRLAGGAPRMQLLEKLHSNELTSVVAALRAALGPSSADTIPHFPADDAFTYSRGTSKRATILAWGASVTIERAAERSLKEIWDLVQGHSIVYLDSHYRILRSSDEAAAGSEQSILPGTNNLGMNLLQSLPTTARDMVGASWASLYTAAASADTEEVAFSRVISSSPVSSRMHISSNAQTIVHGAHRYSRPFIWCNKNVLEGQTAPWQAVRSDSVFEIALPVPATSRAVAPPNLGILVVAIQQRRGETELSRGHIVALTHLCRQVFSESVRSLLSTLRSQDGSRLISDSETTSLDLVERTERTDAVPIDLLAACDVLAPVVARAWQETVASAVTIRAISFDGSEAIRLLSAPAPASYHSLPSIDLREPYRSLTAWVVAEGRIASIRDLSDWGHVKDQCPGLEEVQYVEGRTDLARTRASMMIPIRVHHEIVGTLNFRSPFPGAFEQSKSLIGVVARHIETILGAERHNREMHALALSTGLQAYSHSLSQAARDIRRLSKKLGVGPELWSIADRIDEAIQYAELPRRYEAKVCAVQPGGASNDTTLRSALETAVAEALKRFPSTLEINLRTKAGRRGPDPGETLIRGPMNRALRFALSELFENASRYGVIPAGTFEIKRLVDVQLSRGFVRHDGKEYATVDIVHSTDDQADRLQSLRNRMFREAIGDDNGERHIGTFLAGVALRSEGAAIRVNSVSPLSQVNGGYQVRLRIRIYVPHITQVNGEVS